MKKYYHMVTDTTDGYQEITEYDAVLSIPVVSEIDMLLAMVKKVERKLLKDNLTDRVRALYMRYINELNIGIESLINY